MYKLKIKNWQVTYLSGFEKRKVELIRQIDFSVKQGQAVGIVGESGSGKSIFMKSIMGILSTDFQVNYQEFDFKQVDERPKFAMIFQDAKKSLNPVVSIGKQLMEVYYRYQKKDYVAAKEAVIAELKRVNIPEPEKRLKQYPHELSGGMCQRIMIAMALLTKADILIADEPTTALDSITQKQVLKLLKQLNHEGLTIIMISHDLQVVTWLCDEIYVMRQGEMIEHGSVAKVVTKPEKSYTKKLLLSVPQPALERIRKQVNEAHVTSH